MDKKCKQLSSLICENKRGNGVTRESDFGHSNDQVDLRGGV